MSDKIDVVLKIKDRPYDPDGYLRFWLETFDDDDKYNIILWDDTKEGKVKDMSSLEGRSYRIVTRKEFTNTKEVDELVKSSNLAAGWKKAGFAHLATYYLASSPFFWNIDADDMRFIDPIPKNVISRIEEHCTNGDVFAMSYDIYWTKNLAFPSHPHHWSFGMAFVKRDIPYLSKLVKLKDGPLPGWAINIDVLFEYAKKYKPVQTFVFEGELKHIGQSSKYENGSIYVRHKPEKPWLKCERYEKDSIVFGGITIKTIKSLITDCDGTLTNGKYYYSKDGKELSTFHANDSVAVTYAQQAGLRVIMLTSGTYQEINKKRADDIGMVHVQVPFGEKAKYIKDNFDTDEVAYVGDCFDDADVFDCVALGMSPSDALPEVKSRARTVLDRKGGDGCLLEAWLKVKYYNENVDKGFIQ